MNKSNENSTNNLKTTRPPVVTVMGHVDHGKTTLLDSIRKTNVVAHEFGGITQHTAAYQITYNNRKITFIDTPGHAAFSEMRSRGGKVADIVILVVSVPDGVQPQTLEAISHAKAAGVPIIVALNKMDLPGARENLDKVKGQLAEANILLESYGGDVVSVEISGKTGDGIAELLDVILLMADLADLKFNESDPLLATVIESKIDTKKGLLVSAVMNAGKLASGQKIFYGESETRVRALLNEFGRSLPEVSAGDPVTILGFESLPPVGATLSATAYAVELLKAFKPTLLTVEAGVTTLRVVLKSDTQGTLEALSGALSKLQKPDKRLVVVYQGIGGVNDSDVLLASSGGALILGFNVVAAETVTKKAVDLKVEIKTYSIIYEMLESVEKILEGVRPEEVDTARGRAEVLALFSLPSGDIVAGCKVTKGRLKEGEKVKVTRAEVVEAIYTGRVKKLKEGKSDVDLVTAGKECGVLLQPVFSDLKKGDQLEIS